MNNNVLISEEKLQYLKACEFTLHQVSHVEGLCPNCQKAILVNEFVCLNCGYDNSYTIKEWENLKKIRRLNYDKRRRN